MSKRDETIFSMNRLGGLGKPFLFVINFEMNDAVVLEPPETAGRNILFDFNGRTNVTSGIPPKQIRVFRKHPVSYEEYHPAYERVLAALRRGDSYLVNLTFPTAIETVLDLQEIFFTARAKYRLLFGDRFVCFSPEIFVRIGEGVISSYPMKGTIDADLENGAEILLNDPKELAEHTTIVDLIRNDLNMVATDVRVERFRYIDRLHTNDKDLLQVSSKISGRLPGDYRGRIGDIIFGMLPAGSVTGAPKKRTVQIIREAEQSERGFFTGIAGYFDGSNLDSCVMIRFIEKTANGLRYRSGGGITINSDAESEYNEMIDKVYVPLV